MKYFKEFYIYNKKFLIAFLVIFIVLLSALFYFTRKDNLNSDINKPSEVLNYSLVLFGKEEITVYQNEEYKEPGFYALLNNQFITDKVHVTSFLDTSVLGSYEITYTVGDIKKTRIINVVENPNESIEDIKFSLVGDEKITINKGDLYEELGCLAYDKDGNDISNRVVIEGNVDTSLPGTYYITYSILENGGLKTLKREVVIIEKLGLNLDYSKTYTNKEVVVNVSAIGSDFSYIRFPDGTVSNVRTTTYKISKNGTYNFYVYDNNSNNEVVSVEITNIDKTIPTATCTAKSYTNKTEIVVSASDNIGIDRYIYNNSYTSKSSNYTINSKLKNVNVLVYDKAGNSRNISCQVEESYIEMHFIAGISDDDAILIRTSDKTIMIDGGQWGARTKVVSYLQNLGIKKIDALIGSHVHWNHVQSHAAILDNFEVENLYYSVDILNCVSKKHCKSDDVKYVKDKIKEKNKTPIILYPKDKLIIGEMELYVIGPTRGSYTTYQNANSLVFILKYGNKKFMFTGDTPDNYMNTSKFQTNASHFGMDLDIDVLKWPHHGYEDLTDAFFKATTPEYAIIPNCCWCTSKYPSSTNKKLMKKYNTKYYQVCDSKNIVLTSDGEIINIKTKQKPEDYKK